MSKKEKKVWYSEGLRFQCAGCGGCCTGEEGYVWVDQDDILAIAKELDCDPEEFAKSSVRQVGKRLSLMERPGGDCVLFDPETKGCRCYESRPYQCRTWPFWSQNIYSRHDWALTSADCPGCNQGVLFTLGEIEKLAELEV